MKKMILTLFFISLALSAAHALSGREIMEKSDKLEKPKSSSSTVLMVITQGGDTVEKEFEMISKKRGNRDKVLVSFTRPSQIKLLTHSEKGKEDNQWIRMSGGKMKMISSSEKDQSFVNSHLYYEDLTSRNIDDYDYKYVGDAKAVDADCYVVESVRKSGNRVYSKTVLYVRKADYFVVRVDIYMKGKFHKYLENRDIRKVSNILTPYTVTMTMADGSGKTVMTVKSLKYNMTLADSKFSKEAIR